MDRAEPEGRTRTGRQFPGSVESILAQQTAGGAFPASPDFSQYRYCWLRDSSFIAYALDRVGEHGAARRYHTWVARTIGETGIGPQIDAAIDRKLTGGSVRPGEMPPARFSLSGERVTDDWPNFQIDGYGTWLWGLSEHLRLSGMDGVSGGLRAAVDRTGRYLSAYAFEPCYDVWEEHGEEVHTSTLASVYAGLRAASSMLDDAAFKDRAGEVKERLQVEARRAGCYAKSNVRNEVDASVLWLSRPFGVVEAGDPLFLATAREVERSLMIGGGLRRYAGDTYFGGGTWPVLTCSLGWYYTAVGRFDDARRCLDWTRSHIDDAGRLAEQFDGELRDPAHYREWVKRWGPPARELLWSQAMYVILRAELGGRAW